MDEQEKKDLTDSLKEASEEGLTSPFANNPELERELLIGQLRNIKALIKKAERQNLTGDALDAELDKYSEQRKKYLKEIEEKGFTYTSGEEDGDEYKNYAL